MEYLRKHLSLILKLLVSVGILGYLATKIDWEKLSQVMREADPLKIAIAGLIMAPTFALGAWRWQWLLQVQKIEMSFREALQLSLIGQFFNAFLLGVTGGDVVKIFYAAKRAPEQRSAAALSVVVDRVVGLFALLVIGTILTLGEGAFLMSTPKTQAALYLFLLAAAGGLVFSGLILTLPRWGNQAWVTDAIAKLPLSSTLYNIREACLRFAVRPGVLAQGLAISCILQMISFSANYMLAQAMGLDLPVWAFLAWQPIVIFLMAVPISISGLGVREGLVVIFLGLFGVDYNHAIAFSLAWFGLTLAWSLVGGLVYLAHRSPTDHLGQIAESQT
jgi:glycosyltransferase 2 family protein